MENTNAKGHLLAFITVFIWGTTFISTKILLLSFDPVEILFIRFLMGLLALTLVCPHRLRLTDRKQEFTFVLAGLTGVCLYYLMENIALTYTTASNVGVIISAAPFFTALLNWRNERPKANFFIGFAVSMAGICFISFNSAKTQLNPLGDLLTLSAAFVWACYSTLTRKISTYGYNTIQTTRRTFIYGIIFLVPSLFIFGANFNMSALSDRVNILNLLYLGFGASALCFVTWNLAVKLLGPVKTSVYIYISPVVTVVTSALILSEKITAASAVGTILTLAGLIISQTRSRGKEEI